MQITDTVTTRQGEVIKILRKAQTAVQERWIKGPERCHDHIQASCFDHCGVTLMGAIYWADCGNPRGACADLSDCGQIAVRIVGHLTGRATFVPDPVSWNNAPHRLRSDVVSLLGEAIIKTDPIKLNGW